MDSTFSSSCYDTTPSTSKKSRKRKRHVSHSDLESAAHEEIIEDVESCHNESSIRKKNRHSYNLDSSAEKLALSTDKSGVCVGPDNETAVEYKRRKKATEIKQEMDEEEYFEFDETVAQRLATVQIVLPNEETPTRSLETLVSRLPSKEVMNEIENSSNAMKMCRFNTSEDKIIMRNWITFSETYDFDNPKVFNKILFPKYWKCIPHQEKRNFFMFLADGLPDRYLYSVYSRFLNIYNKTKKTGSFSPSEDEMIISELKSGTKTPYKEVSMHLNRCRWSIYRRAQFLRAKTSGRDQKYGKKWDMDEKKDLILNLLKVKGCRRLKDLRHTTIFRKDWLKVASECAISHNALRRQWDSQLSTQALSKKPIYPIKICLKILSLLREERARHWQDVQWHIVSKEFHGASGMFLLEQFKFLVMKQVPEEKIGSLRFCIKYLAKHWAPYAIADPKYCKEYPRVKFLDDELVEYLKDG